MRNGKWIVAALVAAGWTALIFGAGWLARSQAQWPAHVAAAAAATHLQAPGYALLDEAWGLVRNHFVGVVPSDTVRNYGAVRGMLGTLNDRWSMFVEPQPRAIERDQLRGQFGGIGVNISVDEANRIVLSPMRDSPAAKAGVLEGDVLVAVDGVPLPAGAQFEDIAAKVRGEIGSVVRITVKRGDQALDFAITRAAIEVPSVDWRVITGTAPSDVPVGYIAIRQFTERTGGEVKRAITELRQSGSQAYLIDLRHNTGGMLSAAVEVASQFLDAGNVLIERKRDQADVAYPVIAGGLATKEPLAVLVNGDTASASEIVAGAWQDYRRAKLVGDKTYGKGSVQLLFDLSDGSSVHVTTAKWMTPKARAIDGVGLVPDILVARAEGEIEKGVDSQLDRALQLLRNR